jgi:hypothetical protein
MFNTDVGVFYDHQPQAALRRHRARPLTHHLRAGLGDVDGNGAADFLITLKGAYTLSNADFVA